MPMKTKVALRQLRRERIEREPNRYNQYKEHYRKIFNETKAIGGSDVVKELVEWTTSQTKRKENLPTPATVRKQAAEICTDRDYTIPDESILAELD